MFFMYV